MAAAVVLDPQRIPPGLNDSKKLSEARRLELNDALLACADVASSAVDLACAILGENPATSLVELQETANTIVNSLMISANTCEETCDIGAQIDAAITTKLGE